MNVIARIINGFCSVIGVFLGLLGFLLSGVMASFVPEVAAFTALTTLLPFIIICDRSLWCYQKQHKNTNCI
ncbi:hypothetical protein ACTT3R_001840 [Enterobacter ludwigii]|uniref:hypothetical protein n=1 Tax=Enterobacter ludwigii TaxID=299767 RepID=UPI002074DDB2|nr:hypothetical protein [Enterobacter ludwigii]MCM7268824.1 hypothetical protein [Enterobacter ludwigii]